MINFAFVGCGRIAQKYTEIFATKLVDGAQVVSVCDTNHHNAESTGSKLNVPFYTDMHKMMQVDGKLIHAVIIMTESGNHAQNVIELSAYKKHIIVEKPMALTLDGADSMIEACDREGIKLFVVKQNRYNLPVQKLRDVYEKGAFGKIVMGTVRVRWCRKQEYYDQNSWRGTWAMDGGVFANQASHHIDLLTWFLGEPVSVFAKSRTALVDIEAEDTGVAIVTFKNGVIGVIEATTAVRPVDIEGSLSVLGETGMAEISGFAVNQLKHWHFENKDVQNINLSEFSENPKNVYGLGHVRYLNHVVDCIKNNSASLVDGLEGRKSLELISAIYESFETGKEVFLRFQAKQAKLGFRT